jgi:hypothetical protein
VLFYATARPLAKQRQNATGQRPKNLQHTRTHTTSALSPTWRVSNCTGQTAGILDLLVRAKRSTLRAKPVWTARICQKVTKRYRVQPCYCLFNAGRLAHCSLKSSNSAQATSSGREKQGWLPNLRQHRVCLTACRHAELPFKPHCGTQQRVSRHTDRPFVQADVTLQVVHWICTAAGKGNMTNTDNTRNRAQTHTTWGPKSLHPAVRH